MIPCILFTSKVKTKLISLSLLLRPSLSSPPSLHRSLTPSRPPCPRSVPKAKTKMYQQ